MVLRPLALCLVAGLLSYSALAAESGGADEGAEQAIGTGVGESGSATRVHRRRQAVRNVVSALPPSRPGDLSGETRPDSAVAAGPALAPTIDPAASIPATALLTILPPERPAPSTEATPSTTVDTASVLPDAGSAERFVTVLPPQRPAFRGDEPTVADAALVPAPAPAAPAEQPSLFSALFGSPIVATPALLPGFAGRGHNGIDGLVTTYAKLNSVPEALVHRVIVRESKYNPRAVGRGGALGLMQIKHGTARSLGYDGPASGLLEAETNITYAVKYLAGAYRAAGGDFDRAVHYYASGYYYAAKAQSGRTRIARHNRRGGTQEAEARSDEGTQLAAMQTQ